MTTDLRKMTPAQLRARVRLLEAGLRQWEQAKDRMMAALDEMAPEAAKMAIGQAERLLRSQRYGPADPPGPQDN